MRRSARMSFVASVWLIACASLPIGQTPPRRIEIMPSEALHEWWLRAEACSGVHANFYAARFYVIPVETNAAGRPVKGIDGKGPDSLGFIVAGLTTGNTITVGLPWLARGDIWTHEFGHVKASRGWHNPEIYQRKCRSVMSCVGSCLTDTLPPR